MSVTLSHVYDLDGQQLDNPDRINGAVALLVPTPLPSDLKITVGPNYHITITFSFDHADAPAAAAAALATMKGDPIQ